MARKSGLSMVANRPEPDATPAVAEHTIVEEPAPASVAKPRTRAARSPSPETKPGTSRYAGQFHVGASYDENDDTVEAFRLLAFKTRRSAKDLLHEAMQLLVAKHDPYRDGK